MFAASRWFGREYARCPHGKLRSWGSCLETSAISAVLILKWSRRQFRNQKMYGLLWGSFSEADSVLQCVLCVVEGGETLVSWAARKSVAGLRLLKTGRERKKPRRLQSKP